MVKIILAVCVLVLVLSLGFSAVSCATSLANGKPAPTGPVSGSCFRQSDSSAIYQFTLDDILILSLMVIGLPDAIKLPGLSNTALVSDSTKIGPVAPPPRFLNLAFH